MENFFIVYQNSEVVDTAETKQEAEFLAEEYKIAFHSEQVDIYTTWN